MSVSSVDQVTDFSSCPCGGGTLDKLIQPAMLAVLAEGPLHGYKLAERIGGMPMLGGHKPDVSGVYRSLRAMESKQLVVSSWDMPENGPAKKSYRLTRAGQQCLTHWIESLEQYRRRVTALLKRARRAIANEGGDRGAAPSTRRTLSR